MPAQSARTPARSSSQSMSAFIRRPLFRRCPDGSAGSEPQTTPSFSSTSSSVHRARRGAALHLAVEREERVVARALELRVVAVEIHGATEVRAHGAVARAAVPPSRITHAEPTFTLTMRFHASLLVGEEIHLHRRCPCFETSTPCRPARSRPIRRRWRDRAGMRRTRRPGQPRPPRARRRCRRCRRSSGSRAANLRGEHRSCAACRDSSSPHGHSSSLSWVMLR